MKNINTDVESIKKFINDLGYAKDAISDIQTKMQMEKYETDEEVLDDVLNIKDFLVDAEKHLRESMR